MRLFPTTIMKSSIMGNPSFSLKPCMVILLPTHSFILPQALLQILRLQSEFPPAKRSSKIKNYFTNNGMRAMIRSLKSLFLATRTIGRRSPKKSSCFMALKRLLHSLEPIF